MIRLLIVIFTCLLTQFSHAEQKNFCAAYDTQYTNMQAVDGESKSYSGLPKLISSQKVPTAWDHYCPACTLPDKKICEELPCQQHNIMPGELYAGIQAEGDPWMEMANREALKSVQNGGGPFAGIILQIDDETGKIIRYWVNHNHVAEWNDPTAHAEVTVIRAAAKELGVLDLGHIRKSESKLPQPHEWSHCVLYSSAESCPMCLAATYWAGIKEVAFSATCYDAAVKGIKFLDRTIYEEIARPYAKRQHMRVVHSNTSNSLDAFNYYKRTTVPRYGD